MAQNLSCPTDRVVYLKELDGINGVSGARSKPAWLQVLKYDRRIALPDQINSATVREFLHSFLPLPPLHAYMT